MMMLSMSRWFLAVAAVACLLGGSCEGAATENETDSVHVSPKCAAVLLVGAGSIGAVAASALTPIALCSIGIYSTGIAGGSYAASWQSTMPLVAKGSLFAGLQSAAMSGTTLTVTAGAMLGGAVSISYLQDICTRVNEADPDSTEGQIYETSLMLVTKASGAQEKMMAYCESSPTCSAIKASSVQASVATVKAISYVATETVSAFWEGWKRGYEKGKKQEEEAIYDVIEDARK